MEIVNKGDLVPKISRRQLLKTTLLVGLSFIADNLSISQNPQSLKPPSRKMREDDEIKQKPKIESLTVERARELIPAIVNLFISNTNSDQNPQDLVDNIFIVRGAKSWKDLRNVTDEDLHELPALQNLQRDYPKLEADKNLARDIAGMFPRLGFVTEKERYIFINLGMFDNHNLPIDFKGVEYDKIAGNVSCSTVNAETAFRTVVLHEIGHREAQSTLLLEEELASVYKKLYGDKIKVTEKRGFAIYGKDGEYDRRLPGFDELVVEYLSSRISTRNGLDYSSSFTQPIDLHNFSILLRSSNITNEELLNMYRESKLKELLMRIGFAAKRDITEKEAIEIGMSISFKMNRNERWPIPWDEIKVFFPEIDTRTYKYSELDFAPPRSEKGCVSQ